MKKTQFSVVGLLLCALLPEISSASVVSFDGIDAHAADVDLQTLSPFEGLSWTNTFAYTNTAGFPGFNNGIVSQTNAAYSGGEIFGASANPVVGRISSEQSFDFQSAFLGAGYYNNLTLKF
jgi:hypothetical protein